METPNTEDYAVGINRKHSSSYASLLGHLSQEGEKTKTNHSLPVSYAEGGFLALPGDEGGVFLQLFQELTDRLAVVGDFAVLQERLQLEEGGHRGRNETTKCIP